MRTFKVSPNSSVQRLVLPALSKCPFVTSVSLKRSGGREAATTQSQQAKEQSVKYCLRGKLYQIF